MNDKDYKEKDQEFMTKKELIEFYSARLEFLWGKYVTMIHLLITITGATVLVFFNSIKMDALKTYKSPKLAIAAVSAAGISLAFSFFWRFVAQFFMEHEVLSSHKDASRYFKVFDIDNVTTTHQKHSWSSRLKLIYKIIPSVSVGLLLLGWGLLLVFILINI